MVPLDSVLEKPAPSREPLFVPPKRRPREPKPPEPRAPRRFKIVDVVSQAVLAEDASTRDALDVLSDVRSIVDVHVSVWEPNGGSLAAAHAWRAAHAVEPARGTLLRMFEQVLLASPQKLP